MTGSARVRRAPHLVCYWSDEGMVFTNYSTNSSVVGDALVSHVLSRCTDWTTVRCLRDQLRGMTPRAVDDLVAYLIEQRLLLRWRHRPDPRDRALDSWKNWNPAAGFFHFSTKDLRPPRDPERAEQALRDEANTGGAPAVRKRYPR